MILGLCVGVTLIHTGCATGRTEVERTTTLTNGIVITERTFTRASTFADGKNKLSDFKAGQTKTTQTIGIGEQGQESTSELFAQMMAGLQILGRIAAATQGIPLPAPAVEVKTNAPPK